MTGDADRKDMPEPKATVREDLLATDSQARLQVIAKARALADEAATKARQVEGLMLKLSELLLERDDDQPR